MKKPEFKTDTTKKLVKAAQFAGAGENPKFDQFMEDFHRGADEARRMKADEVPVRRR